MITSRLEADPILRYLFERSSFTQAQLDTYLINCATANEKAQLKDKITMRDRKKVSKGAFIRTLRQAQGNLKKSVFTLILSEYLGLLEDESMVRLSQVSTLLKGAGEVISGTELPKVVGVLESIVETLSGGKKK